MYTCDTVCVIHPSPSPLDSDESDTVGERTPVKARMTEHIPPQWQICHVARQFKAAVAGPGVRETLEVKRVVERKDGTFDYGEWCVSSAISAPAVLDGARNSTNAELTDFGRKVWDTRQVLSWWRIERVAGSLPINLELP